MHELCHSFVQGKRTASLCYFPLRDGDSDIINCGLKFNPQDDGVMLISLVAKCKSCISAVLVCYVMSYTW